MKIDLRKLIVKGVERQPFAGSADLSGEMLYGEYPFQNPVEFEGDIVNHHDVLSLKGRVGTEYVTSCARCLKPLKVDLSADVDMLLAREDSEEDDVFVVEGDSVDPAEVIIPALLLEAKMVYLCNEDCKGLCPHCGADRNTQMCDCGGKQIDDRLAVLQTLLNKKQDDETC